MQRPTMDKDQKLLALSAICGALMVNNILGLAIVYAQSKKAAKFQMLLDAQNELLQWTANNALELDRNEFATKFEEKAEFLNIVYKY